jgi:hypothetical protein
MIDYLNTLSHSMVMTKRWSEKAPGVSAPLIKGFLDRALKQEVDSMPQSANGKIEEEIRLNLSM